MAWVPVKRSDLQRKIQEYVRKIGREQRGELPLPPPEEESKELFTLVLQPVLADLSTFDTVTVDFDAAMNGLPVEALMSPEGWYFGQRYPVIYSPGYLRENELRKSPQQVPSTGLLLDALGDKETRDHFKELVPRPTMVIDAAGSPVERPSLLAQSEVFVFVGHGRSGALILANGEPLKAEDFPPAASENMQLVVLVACSSAVAREGLLDTANLVHAFQSGGTPNVIASQWNVVPEATKEFMNSFFTHLKNTESPARALYEARKELFRTKNHPYYWAAFTLSGRS
jgi:CHAT domain-containing protein